MIDGSPTEVFVNEVRWESGVEEVLEASSVFVSTATASLPAAILITRTREYASGPALMLLWKEEERELTAVGQLHTAKRGAI